MSDEAAYWTTLNQLFNLSGFSRDTPAAMRADAVQDEAGWWELVGCLRCFAAERESTSLHHSVL